MLHKHARSEQEEAIATICRQLKEQPSPVKDVEMLIKRIQSGGKNKQPKFPPCVRRFQDIPL
eukprot:1030355-Lingulodinium_polyedra.AAC.1